MPLPEKKHTDNKIDGCQREYRENFVTDVGKTRMVIQNFIKRPRRNCGRQDIVEVHRVVEEREDLPFRQRDHAVGKEHEDKERKTADNLPADKAVS